jgi:ubiquinol-cytochrome c reductase cytochrome b subunit/menaquinol-cytochrome c reductase cytochrome b/c subunit
MAIAGCGGSTRTFTTTSRNGLAIAVPPGVQGQERARAVAGEVVVGRDGCLACHVIGHQGNNGPGPNLTHIGSQLPPTVLVHVLRSPSPPMPSFASLSRAQLADVVEFLHTLR